MAAKLKANNPWDKGRSKPVLPIGCLIIMLTAHSTIVQESGPGGLLRLM